MTTSQISTPKLLEVNGVSGYTTETLVKVVNRRTGELKIKDERGIRLTLNSNDKCLVNLDELASGWLSGDVIEVTLSGSGSGSATVTLTAGPAVVRTAAIARATFTPVAWTV